MQDLDPDFNYDFFSQSGRENCNYVSLNQYHEFISSSNVFSIMNYNIRSFHANFQFFSPAFSFSELPTILILTETWFSPGQTMEIPGFTGYHVVREGRSGGVSIFVKDYIDSCIIPEFSYVTETIEVCSVEVKINSISYFIVGVYRPHSDSISNFSDRLSNFLETSSFMSRNCILLGDFNICLLKDSVSTHEFLNALYSNHFIPIITKATHFSEIEGVLPSLLDHIYINKTFSFTCGVLDYKQTDHLPTFINIDLVLMTCEEKIKTQFRLKTEANKIKFTNLFSNFDWNSLPRNNLNSYAECLLNSLNDLYCEAFPLKTKFVKRQHYYNTWVTPEIKSLIRSNSDYFYLFKINMITKEENNAFKNRVNRIVKNAKIAHHRKLFYESSNNIKKTWKHINSLLTRNLSSNKIQKIIVDGLSYESELEIANIFNNHFCSIGDDLESEIPNTSLDPLFYINNNLTSSFWLNPTTPLEVENIIN